MSIILRVFKCVLCYCIVLQFVIMAPPPVVTGISPKEGPPGTRVTVRGEFLGNKPGDLIGMSFDLSHWYLNAISTLG